MSQLWGFWRGQSHEIKIVRNIELIRSFGPNDLPKANSVNLCNFFNSCNQRDVVTIILMNCQKINYWTPTYISDIYDNILMVMCKRNYIDHFGNNQYCLTDSIIKKLYYSINGK